MSTARAGRSSDGDTTVTVVQPAAGRPCGSGVEQGAQCIVPRATVVELVVKLEQVVMVDRPTIFDLAELRREAPRIQLDTARNEEIDGSGFGALHDGHVAVWAAKAVLTAVVAGADSNPNVGGGEFHVAAGFAARSNRSHGVVRPRRYPCVDSIGMATVQVEGFEVRIFDGFARLGRLRILDRTRWRTDRELPRWAAMSTRIAAMWSPPVLFAHRGAKAHARDNTIDAFELAVRLGATGIETDAWVTADGEVVLDHDGWHRRLPRRWIREVDRAELKPHIPTLAEFYGAVGTDLPLSVDVKDPATFDPLVATARAHDALDRLWVCHPDLEVLQAWRDRAPDAHLVNSTSLDAMEFGPERRAAELAAARIDAVNLRQQHWTGGLTTLFHRFDVLCFGWDAQHERQIARLLDLGIDALYSDYVDRMVAVGATFGFGGD